MSNAAAVPAPPISKSIAYAALAGGALAMAVSPILVRLTDVGPFASAFWRVFLALPVLYAWSRLEPAPTKPNTRAIIATGAIFGGDLLFWHLAILGTTIANATFFATAAPLWVVILGFLIYGRRFPATALAGLALCLVGGAALVWHSLAFAPERLMGDTFAVITGVFFGGYFLAMERARVGAGAGTVTFRMSLVAAAVLAIGAIVASAVYGHAFFPRSLEGWVLIVALGIVSHAGGQGLLSIALGSLPVLFSSLVMFLEALVAATIAWFVFAEAITPLQGLGALLIVAGMLVARPRS